MGAVSSLASALSMDFAQSLAGRRQRPSHAKARSTTHLRGSTSKPFAVSERFAICNVQRPKLRHMFGPAWPPSASIWRSFGAARRSLANTPGAPMRS